MKWLPVLLITLFLAGCAGDPQALDYRAGGAAGSPAGDFRQVALVRRTVTVQLQSLETPDPALLKPSAAVIQDRLELDSPGTRVRVTFPRDSLGHRGTAVQLDGQEVPLTDAAGTATPEAWPLPQALPALDGLTPLVQVRPTRMWQADLELSKGKHLLELHSRVECTRAASADFPTAWWQGAYSLGNPEQWASVGPLVLDWQLPALWPHALFPPVGEADGPRETAVAWNLRHPDPRPLPVSLPMTALGAVLGGFAVGAFVGHFQARVPRSRVTGRRRGLPRNSPLLYGLALGLLAGGAVSDQFRADPAALESQISWLVSSPGAQAWAYGLTVFVGVAVVGEISLRWAYRFMTGRPHPENWSTF